MGRGCARRPSGLCTALPAGQYVPNYIWNDTESDGDYKPINIPFTGVEGLREEHAIICIICKETNRYAEQYIEADAANVRPKFNSS